MRCLICEGTEWKNVDEFRMKPEGMAVCTNCGFISYPEKYKTKDEILDHYRNDYRAGPPVAANLFTGQRKLHYHNEFLMPLYKKWKEVGKNDPTICDVGAAFGMVLEMFKRNIPGSKLYGTELTETYRRVAWNEYGIELTEDFNDTVKYDMVMSYKSAEHILDADIEMRKWITSLSEDGVLYIGVPIWFGTLHNFGVGGYDIEYYYHPNHVNVWSETTFRTLLKKIGAEIVSENHTFYDSVFLCKRNDALMTEPPVYDGMERVMGYLASVRDATVSYAAGKFSEAIGHWTNFPIAHVHEYETNRAAWHQKGWDAIEKDMIGKAFEECPNNGELHCFAGELAMRYDQWDIAIGFFQKALKLRPKDTIALEKMAVCLSKIAAMETDAGRRNKIYANARKLSQFIAESSMQFRDMGINMSFAYSAKMPLKDGT